MDHSNYITIGGQDIAIGDSGASKKQLPPGTERNVFQGYEEVSVPAVDPGKLLQDEKLVEVAELEDWARSAFKGYKTLNRIQSRIFEVCTLLSHAAVCGSSPSQFGKPGFASLISTLQLSGCQLCAALLTSTC